MSSLERRKLFCSVSFHFVAIICVIWSLYVLIDRTAAEIRTGVLAWPFWTKLVVVGIGFSGGLVFMYVQCKVYVHLFRKWRAYNRIIVVQDAPEGIHKVSSPISGGDDVPSFSQTSHSNRQERPPETTRQAATHSGPVSKASSPDRSMELGETSATRGRTNAETQTNLRGVSLREMGGGAGEGSANKSMKVVAVLDGSEENSGPSASAAFFFTECECSSDNIKSVKVSVSPNQLLEATLGNGELPGSPIEAEGRSEAP